MKKKVTLIGLAVAVFAVAGILVANMAFAQTNSQKISFNFNPTDGIGWGGAWSMVPPWTGKQAAAQFDGTLLTRPSGQVDITTLTGNLKFNPGAPDEEVYTLQLKPDGTYKYTSGPYPGCSVTCHTTLVVAQAKYQGAGSSARDGVATIQWQTVSGLPVPPVTRQSAYLWGQMVSKDQAWSINMWDRGTPTIQ